MQQGLLPLFPLELVLFPGGELPLHIFEDRYKEMIGEAISESTEFGIVLANSKGLANIGCTATVDRVLREYTDGRLDILTVGRRRFEILLVNEERAFLRGAVDFFDDEASTVPSDVRERAVAGHSDACTVSGEPPLDAASLSDPLLSFRLVQAVPDLLFRQTILNLRNEADRMARLADFLPRWAASQSRLQKIKTVAPTNGHGHAKVPGQ